MSAADHQYPDFTGLTLEKVWALIKETDRQMQETDSKMQEFREETKNMEGRNRK